jgi:uncharacterized protein
MYLLPLGLGEEICAGTTSVFFTIGNARRLHGAPDQRQLYRACYGLLVVTR